MFRVLGHVMGLDDASGPWYLFWSGIGADLGMFVAVYAFLKHVNCHTRGCWRIGRHHLDGTKFRVCRYHKEHP